MTTTTVQIGAYSKGTSLSSQSYQWFVSEPEVHPQSQTGFLGSG